MAVKISIVASGIGAIFALFGAYMLYDATKVANAVNQTELNTGWDLVAVAVFLWVVALLVAVATRRRR